MFASQRNKLVGAGALAVGGLLATTVGAGATVNSGTATESLTAGTYSVLGQGTIGFPATTLTGVDQTLAQTGTGYIDFSDATGSGLGWNVTAQLSTVFTNSRSVADGATTNSSTTVTSATAAFVAGDAGRFITGAGIPALATISSVTNATTVVISAAATATAASVGLTFSSTLPAATVTLQSRTALGCDASTTCTIGANPGTITYPVAVPTTPTAAAKIFNASAGTGLGNQGFGQAQTWALGGTIPANAKAVAYTGTITYTMSNGI